jgi:hypothetical protein
VWSSIDFSKIQVFNGNKDQLGRLSTLLLLPPPRHAENAMQNGKNLVCVCVFVESFRPTIAPSPDSDMFVAEERTAWLTFCV